MLILYVVLSPKNALFINLVKSFKFILKHNNIAPTFLVFNDHHHGAFSVPN